MGKEPAHDNRVQRAVRRAVCGLRRLTACVKRSPVGPRAFVGVTLRRCTVFALFLGLQATVTRSQAAPFDLANSDWEGCAELVRLARSELDSHRVVASAQIDFRELKPEDGLLLLHPETNLDVEELSKFMRAGGRVTLFDDFGRGDALLWHFAMSRVPIPAHPVEFLRGNPQFALAEPASAHPVVKDVTRVVTNHPTGLAHPDLSPVLKIRGGTDGLGHAEGEIAVAVAGAVGEGRLLSVGDPSIVMNSMLRYGGNQAFARGVIRYTVERDASSKGGGRLFIAAGDIKQRGAFGGNSSALTDAIRQLRDALDATKREGVSPTLAYVFACILGLGLLVWVGLRAGRLHKPITPRFVRSLPTVAQGGIAGHAAVLAARETPRLLAVLELKSALEEQLASQLGLAVVPGPNDLLAEVSRRGLLDSEGMVTLRRVLLRMVSVESMLVSQRSGGTVTPIRDHEVLTLARTVARLVETSADARLALPGSVSGNASVDARR